MESQYWNDEVQQSAWLLDYDRRCMLDCADTFQNLAAVMGEMNWELEQEKTPDDREELLRRRQAMESRKQYAAHMRQMAGMLQSVADTSVQLIRLGGRQEKQIVRALAGEGIVVEDIYLLRGKEDRLQITISVRLTKNKSMTVEEIAGYLSVLMDIRLVPQKRNPYFVGEESVSLYFEEEPIFSCLTAAACATEETESVSGDSYSFLETDDSVAMILSDGVGSGESAARDSGRIVDLTERILDAGLGPDMAMLFLNGMAGAEGDENRMATLDLCRIDLYRGECETVKAGGAAGFIKRSDRVEKIQSRQLPLGMSASEDISEKKWQLNSGDLVILVSDGVVQNWPCGDGEYLLEQKIASLNVSSPVDLANLILRYAIRQCGGKIRDDMTVLVTGIWKNEEREIEDIEEEVSLDKHLRYNVGAQRKSKGCRRQQLVFVCP